MTEQRQKLIDRFQRWLNTNPNKRIVASQCANIAERYAKEVQELTIKNKKMKFTHILFTTEGWAETNQSPSGFKEVKHLGKCPLDGDMFAAYSPSGTIEIFKGVLEEEKNLKTDIWYRNKNSSLLVYRTGNKEKYGIRYNKDRENYACFEPENWQEAPEEEVKKALVKIAKKKGFKNIRELKIKDPNGKVYEKGSFITDDNEFRFEGDTLFLDGVDIFKEGKWVEILEEPLSIEERLKMLEEKIKNL